MNGITAPKQCGRALAGGLLLVATSFMAGCGNSPPSPAATEAPARSGPVDQGMAAPKVSTSPAAQELERSGVSVTEFTPKQEASLYVTMGIEGMEVKSDGYEIPPSISVDSVVGKPFLIPSDLKARWGLIDIDQKAYPTAMIFTHRTGPSGTTFSIRQYDCGANTVRYVATGETIADMRASKADERMSEIYPRSIAYYLGKLACTRLAD